MAVRKIGAPGGLKCAQIFLIAVNETDQDRDEIRREVVEGQLVQFHSSGFAIEIGGHDQSLEMFCDWCRLYSGLIRGS